MYNVSKIQGKRLRAVLLSSTNEFQDHHEHHLHLSKLQGGKSGRRMFARLFFKSDLEAEHIPSTHILSSGTQAHRHRHLQEAGPYNPAECPRRKPRIRRTPTYLCQGSRARNSFYHTRTKSSVSISFFPSFFSPFSFFFPLHPLLCIESTSQIEPLFHDSMTALQVTRTVKPR